MRHLMMRGDADMMGCDPDLQDMECDDCWAPDLQEEFREDIESMTAIQSRDKGPSIGIGTVALGATLAAANARMKAKEQTRQSYGGAPAIGCVFPLVFLAALLNAIADYGIWEGLLTFWPIWAIIALIKIEKIRTGL